MKCSEKENYYRDRKQIIGCLGMGAGSDYKWAQGVSLTHGNVLKLDCGAGCTTQSLLKLIKFTLIVSEFYNM